MNAVAISWLMIMIGCNLEGKISHADIIYEVC